MLIAALFIITQSWKQPRCPSGDECINKSDTTIQWNYYPVIKRNELLTHKNTWVNLKCIFLSERSQCEKATFCMVPIRHSGKGKTIVMTKRPVIIKGFLWWRRVD